MYLCTWYHLALNSTMAKVGYIFKAAGYDGFDTDVEWMKQYGCVQVIEEENGHEKLRPQWKQLMASLYNRQIKKFPTEKQNVSLKHILT